VALADLEPRDADGYLKASRGMANLKRFDRAVALCRQAALVDPSNSRALEQGLRFSEIASDADGMAWAAGGLLKQEWPERNTELQGLAKRSLEAMAHHWASRIVQKIARGCLVMQPSRVAATLWYT